MTTLQIIGFIVVALLGLYVFYCIYDLGRRQKSEDRSQNKNKVLTVLLTMAALFAGQQAFAETVTYTLSGTTAQNGHVELIVNASGSVSGTVTDQWDYTTTQTRTINLPGDITFNFGSDKTNSLSVRSSALHIGANSSTGGYITLTHGSKYIYHVTLRDRSNNVVHEAWNMAKSYEYRFQEIVVRSIEVEYATAIPITDAVISSINNSYYISNTAVTPNPTITWHDNTLTKGTHYTVGYQNNTTAGTATVTATGKGIFSTNTSVSKNYALVWATYTVHFNKNHNDATGTMSNQNFTYNTAQNLTANVFSRTYYDFAGWSTSVNGAVEYVDGQLVNNLTPINNETVTLYAKWNAINYNITYDLDGGSVVTANPTTYNVETPTFTLNNPTKPGYTFNGWTGTDLTEATQTVTIIQGSTGDRSYTAHWTPITYTVHFNANGGSGEMSDQNFTYNTAQNLTANAFSRTYYDFAGWSTSVNGAVEYADGQLVNNLTPINNETVTLYAKWNAINYNITYDLDGGSVATANPTTYNVETPTFTLNNPTKPGYTFNGWTGTDLTETTQTVTITLGSTGDRSYTALWTPNTYTVHFDANNGEGTMNDMSFTYDQTQNLTANTFTRENYNFSGWNTSANGSGTSYTDGQSVSNLTTESNGTVTLYAQWANIYWQGSGTEDDPYIISNTAGLDHLASEVNSGNNFSGIYFKLGNNIEYDPNNLTIDGDGDGNNDSNYTAIGGNHDGSYKVFKGSFDGQGHTVSGIRIYKNPNQNNIANHYQGLFGNINGATVKNITLANANITGVNFIGGIVGKESLSTVKNCHAIAVSISGKNRVGGIAGDVTSHGSVDSCQVSRSTINGSNYYVGGIAGYFENDMQDFSIKNCNVNNNTIIEGLQDVGGIVGCSYSDKNSCVVENCHVANITINVTSSDGLGRSGGIVGYNKGITRYCTAIDVTVSGYNHTGGIAGYNTNNGKIQYCMVNGTTVSATGDQVGGIVGYNVGNTQYCTAIGVTVSATGDNGGSNNIGGIVGYNLNSSSSVLYCTVNGATISATGSKVGGVVGYNNSSGTIQYCMVNSATISGDNSVGSILGFNYQTEGPRNNYYHNCKVNGTTNATNVGCGSTSSGSTPSDITLMDGAVYAVIRMVEGYGESTASDHWTFISSPLSSNTTATDVVNLINTTTPANYDFSKLVNTTWANYKEGGTLASGFSLENGQGYLYANKDNVGLVFKGTYNSESTQDVTLQQGWNLVGNPLTDSAYINTPFYKMNAAGTGIEAVSEYWNNKLAVCTGVVVYAANAGNVTFSKTVPDHSTGNNGLIQMTLAQTVTNRGDSSTETLDNAIITFNEGSQLGKFYFGEQNANIYIPQDGKDYAIAYSDGHGEMPLNFKAKENGEYTITVNCEDVGYLHLIDNLTGVDIDLLTTPSYTFTAQTTDYESRFKLVFSAKDNENDNENEDFAFISNGEIIVNGEGILQIIDALGRTLFTKELSTFHSQLSTLNFAPGVYVLRLVNGQNVKTQKIIVK